MLFLITGTVGSGKTAYAISRILEYRKTEPTRQIYTNIDGINIPDVIFIDHNDYEQYADGSIFFFDEAQQFINFKASHEAKDDKITQSLQVSRHRGFDIFFITQHPSFLSKWVTCLINEHFHLVNAMGLKASTLYRFTGVKGSLVNLDVLKDTALDVKRVTFDNTVFDKYKSASMHTKKFVMPKKLKFYIFLFILILAGFFYLIYYNYKNNTFDKATVKKTSSNSPSSSFSVFPANNNKNIPQPINNQISSTQITQQPSQNQNQNLIEYNINNPFDVKIANNQRTAVSMPVFSGCVEMGKKISCYTEQGTLLKVDSEIAKRVVNGEIPYNYFKQPQQPQHQPTQETKPTLKLS